MSSILQLNQVNKIYGDTQVVNNVSFDVPEKSVFGLLGPNGAGKTTLIRIITNIIQADGGNVYLKGINSVQDRMYKIGYMPEERGLYKKMKVGEQLMYLAQLKDLPNKEAKERVKYWLDRFNITDWWGKKIEELSKGMQQKIQFIATVVHNPKLIILDEPFSGLDPINTNLIRDEIFELQQQGMSVIFSTHRMEQVEAICEDIALINKGEILLQGKVNDIKQQFKESKYSIEFEGELPDTPNSIFTILDKKEGQITVHLQENQTPNSLLQFFIENKISIHSFNEILPTLNEIFIQQVGGATEE